MALSESGCKCGYYARFRDMKVITVEPVIFLYMFASYLLTFLGPLYFVNQYQAAAIASAVARNSTDSPHCRDLARPNGSRFACISNADLDNCTNSSGSDSLAEESSTTLILLTNVVGQVPSIATALVLGPLSDRVGRKPMMLALSASGAVSAGLVLAITCLGWDIHIFVLASFVVSLGGGATGLFTSTFAYIADVSSPRWLTIRIGLAESMIVLSLAACTAVAGAWLESSGCDYTDLGWLMLACYLAAGLYVLFFLPESLDREERLRRLALAGKEGGRDPSGSLLREVARGLEIVFLPGHASSRWRVWIYLYTLGVYYLVAAGLSSVSTLYLSHLPLQWGPKVIGFYGTAFFASHGAALLFVLPALVALKVHDSIIPVIGMGVSASMAVLNIFVQTPWQMFAVGTLMGIEAIGPPAMRSMMSASVNPSDKGYHHLSMETLNPALPYSLIVVPN